MKAILIALTVSAIFLQVALADSKKCGEECFVDYCIAPNKSTAAQKKCSDDAQTMLNCVETSCKKDGYSDGCIKNRCGGNRAFLSFFHCLGDCYNNVPQPFTKAMNFLEEKSESLQTTTKTFNRIHDLSKRNKLIERGTNDPVPKPQPKPEPAKPEPPKPEPKKDTFSSILSVAIVALLVVFAF